VEGVFRRDVQVGEVPRYRRFRGRVRRAPLGRARALTASHAPQRNAALAMSGRRAAAAWEERRGGHDRVYLAVCGDAGRHWSRAVRPAGRRALAGDEQWPAVALAPGGRVTVAWTDTAGGTPRVMFAHTGARGGSRFSAPRPIDASLAATVAQSKPALAQGPGDTVHAAWIDERERSSDDDLPQAHLFYARIRGGQPGAGQRLDQGAPASLAAKLDNAWAPSVAARGRRVLVTWIDFQNYDWGVFSRASADGGASFGAQVRVTDNREDDPATSADEQQEELAAGPDATLAGGAPLIAWTDWRKRDSSATKPHEEYDTFIASPGGANRQVDPYGGAQVSTFAPSVCATGRRDAVVAFQDSSRGRSEVRAVTVRGGTRRGRALPVSDAGPGGGNAWRPRIACSGGRALVVWEDERDGPPRLYYSTGAARRLR
jgi:hypothetical protein